MSETMVVQILTAVDRLEAVQAVVMETLSIGELTRLEGGRSNGRAGSTPVVSASSSTRSGSTPPGWHESLD